ncbi:glycosyltransferase [Puteibacter caeruleilacunae]|nr:glycosyltransferase [Puteibacter caeruleilacunae]
MLALFYMKKFADQYLRKQNPPLYEENIPNGIYDMIVVIPCFNEPEIEGVLDSLKQCKSTKGKVLVLVVVNASEISSESIIDQNIQSLKTIEQWQQHFDESSSLELGWIQCFNMKKKWAGAGWARKLGMDRAISLFNEVDNADGILISLDADCVVQDNYLQEIERYFEREISMPGATIYFEHPLNVSDERLIDGIVFYELYMRYYKHALAWVGYPHAMYTVGSAFAVRAEAYVSQGGMNRKKAGEDFYFLHKLTPKGALGEINGTTVFPGVRISNRVPFGTGPVLQQWIDGDRSINKTYSLESFKALRLFFEHIDVLYQCDDNQWSSVCESLPHVLKSFLEENEIKKEIDELSNNCTNQVVFTNRFWQLFNAFRILKFMNYARENAYPDADLYEEAEKLIVLMNYSDPDNIKYIEGLLELYREIDKSSN